MSKYTEYFKEIAINNMCQKSFIKGMMRLTIGNNTSITFTYKTHRVTGSLGNGLWYFVSDNPNWNANVVTGTIEMANTNYETGVIKLKCPRPLIHIFSNLEPGEHGYKDLFDMIFVSMCAEAYVPYDKSNTTYTDDGNSATYTAKDEDEDENVPNQMMLEIRGSYICMIFKFNKDSKVTPDTFKIYDALACQYVDYTEFI